MPELSAVAKRLSQELLRLRDLAGLSGREMARRTKVSQPMMSRIDRGLNLPSMPVVRRWLDEVAADDDTRARVLALAEAAHSETRPWRVLFEQDGHLQAQMHGLDQASVRIRNFQPTVLPGLLQTAAYARAVLERGRTTDVAAGVAARLERQQLLHERGRHFEFVITEQLLTTPPGEGALVGQADRLLSLSTLDTVDVAVLPTGVDPGVSLWHNFVIREPADPEAGTVVSIELQHGSQAVSDPESVKVYEEVWDRLWAAAATGDDAVALLRETR